MCLRAQFVQLSCKCVGGKGQSYGTFWARFPESFSLLAVPLTSSWQSYSGVHSLSSNVL